MVLWGSLFPFVKIGYDAFGIDTESVPDILLFAAIRFILCGVIVSLIALIGKHEISGNKLRGVGIVVLMGFFSIVLHYAFTYIGLTMTDSSKTALLKQLGSLFYICLAFLFIKGERFSVYKIIGAVLGFAGIIAINLTGGSITFMVGDILIILASVCSVVATVINKSCARTVSPFWITGISQLFGGVILLAAGFIMGGKMPVFTLRAVLVLAYICTASIIAYVVFSYALKEMSSSTLLIIKFAEPLFACVFGWLLLGEDILKIQYLLAFVLISAGIYLGSKTKETEMETETEVAEIEGDSV
jgi:drug/metabolite transporter (DMT)-like permease